MLFNLIEEAARAGNLGRVEKLILAVKAIETNANRPNFLDQSGGGRQNAIDQMPVSTRSTVMPQNNDPQDSARIQLGPSRRSKALEQGKAARREWLVERRSAGIVLKPLRGQRLYQDAKGNRIGIAFANEQPQRHLLDKWWIGLPDGQYEAIVLLCRDLQGKVTDFVLPKGFLDPFWSLISRGGPNQVEFHVHRRGQNYVLDISGLPPHSINEFLSNYECL